MSAPPRLHYDVHPGQGPWLLLLHGFLSSRAQWADNLESLGRFCRPVTAELWGHGRSPSPTDPAAYGIDGYNAQLEILRAELAAGRWFVCGQSFAAGLALRYGLSHPQALSGLIVTNSVSAFTQPTEDQAARSKADAIEAGGHDTLRALPQYPRAGSRLSDRVNQGLAADAAFLSPAGIANGLRYTAGALAIGPGLADLTVPTLLVNGRWEKAFQPLRAVVERRSKAIDVVDLEGGHAINAEAPAEFERAVGRFLQTHT